MDGDDTLLLFILYKNRKVELTHKKKKTFREYKQ